MFLSREEKEIRRQKQDKIQKFISISEQLKQQLVNRINDFERESEEFIRANSEKWQYTQITTKSDDCWQQITELGDNGWEMVSIATFQEGGTFNGSGGYTSHIIYVFKRPVKLPQEIKHKYADISELQKKIGDVEAAIKVLKGS